MSVSCGQLAFGSGTRAVGMFGSFGPVTRSEQSSVTTELQPLKAITAIIFAHERIRE